MEEYNNTTNTAEFVSKFQTEEEKQLSISPQAITYIKEVAKWAKFFAILGFVFIGLMVLIAIIMGFFLPSLNSELAGQGAMPMGVSGTILALVYIALAAVYVYPIFMLLAFANKTNQAIKEFDSKVLEDAFGKLKSHFKYVGWFTIIFIGIYVFVIFAAMMGGLMGGILSTM